VEPTYPLLEHDLERDAFVVWVRWVSMEDPPSPDEPARQGIRVELMLNRNSVLGPTILSRRDLEEQPVYLRANTVRTHEILRAAASTDKPTLDIQLVIHGSVANAPYVALHHLRDYEGEPIDTAQVAATPLLQIQPSTPGDRWHVAGQANLRVRLELTGGAVHLHVVR
jgi:hypothetical protein